MKLSTKASIRFVVACALLSLGQMAWGESPSAPGKQGDCHIGIYQFANGADVDIGPGLDGKLRWRRKDGTSGELTLTHGGKWTSTLGWTGKPDGVDVVFGSCESNSLRFKGEKATRIAFDVIETRFAVEDAQLVGRLILPKGTGKVPVVVLLHGAEHDSARTNYSLQRLFPSEGIGVFVYDKRGTGESGGDYTQQYLVLADDAIAALHEAKRLAGTRAGRVGYQAGSQGGWVAPLAATIEPVDFVIVGFGLAVSPLQEDRSAIGLDVTDHGYGPDVLAKAMQIADASAVILSSDFQNGYDQLNAVRQRFGNEEWFHYIKGDVTWALLAKSPDELRILGPKLFAGLPTHYDPMPVLRNLAVPQLWIMGEDDHQSPSKETSRRLRALNADGRPISFAMFPHAEHGIYEYVLGADGERLSTRQPDGYFAMMSDFIRNGTLDAHYGDAAMTRASSAAKPEGPSH